jgi:hypothetical protein
MVVLITLSTPISMGFFIIVGVDCVPLGMPKNGVDDKNLVTGARHQVAEACDTWPQ